jgi:uncharacterized protein
MPVVLEALLFGITVAFMLLGIAGIIIPILPGMVLIWLSALVYAVIEGFAAVDWITFGVITIIALVAGTSEIWLPLLGAKTTGASRRSLVLGALGGILGFFFLGAFFPIIGSLFGGVIGYSLGILLGQYHKYRDWGLAIRAGLGGLAGWGVSTAIQLGAGLIIIAIFVWQVLAY